MYTTLQQSKKLKIFWEEPHATVPPFAMVVAIIV